MSVNKFVKLFIIASVLASCLTLSGCDNIKLVDISASGDTSSSTESESETTPTDANNDSWQTETLASSAPVTVSSDEPSDTDIPETFVTEETSSTPETAETTADTADNEEETDTKVSISEFPSSFNAKVLSAERKYIIVKPDIGSDEFEISRKIIVYCSNAVDIEIGDSVEIKYSGDFDTYEDDMPVISDSECIITANGAGTPSFMSDTEFITVEVIRVYNDGFLGKVLKDAGNFADGDKINVDISTDSAEGLEKGQIIEICYKGSPTVSDDDFPTVKPDDFKITFNPSYVCGKVVSVNDKGIVLSYESGTFSADESADIIIISDKFSDVEEGDVLKIIYNDDITEEPFIIYDVESFEKGET